jgi:hypothetical protein
VYGVHLSGDYGYLAAGDSGMRVLDISNPEGPLDIGDHAMNGCSTVDASGVYVYASDDGGTRIIDVSDPYYPELAAKLTGRQVAVDGALATTVTGYGYELRAYDVSDPYTPLLLGVLELNRSPNPDPVVHQGHIYQLLHGLLILEPDGEGYSISGHVEDSTGSPIPYVRLTAGAYSAFTDAAGDYSITGVLTGTYTLAPSKAGYTFTPETRTVTVPPDATGQDFTGTPISESGLVYQGPNFLPSSSVMLDEVDGRITMGDHVHLRLPFRNASQDAIQTAAVSFLGGQQTGNAPGVSIYSGSDWRNLQQVALTPSYLPPGATGYAEFWIYVTDNDPDFRNHCTGRPSFEQTPVRGNG